MGQSPTLLPTVSFGPHRVTRLVGGGNPLCGGSHWSARRSRDMAEFHTAERVVEHLHRLEACGINTIQARGDYHRVLHWLELCRREGGNLQWVAQTASEMHDVFQNIRILAAAGAIGIYHHGTATDRFWHEGRIDEAKDFLACMRDQGVQVGLGTHIPEVIEYVEAHDWDVDFYMTAVYNLNRDIRESELVQQHTPEIGRVADDDRPTVDETFLPEDPPRMLNLVRHVDKPCWVFKILGAGRHCASQEDVRQAFKRTFAGIKPSDVVVVGMWQKYQDQIGLNTRYDRETLAELGGHASMPDAD